MKIRLINYNKKDGVWDRWFYFEKRWGNKLIYIGIKNKALCIDLRKNIFDDIRGGKI